MNINNILYMLGIICITGAVYLTAAYARYLSQIEKLIVLLLVVAICGFLGKYFEERGL
jgi:hypothetical protein